MSSFNQDFKSVKELVTTFRVNESYYISSQYLAVEARSDFTDRLFMALGWDVRQETHYSNDCKSTN